MWVEFVMGILTWVALWILLTNDIVTTMPARLSDATSQIGMLRTTPESVWKHFLIIKLFTQSANLAGYAIDKWRKSKAYFVFRSTWVFWLIYKFSLTNRKWVYFLMSIIAF